MKVLVAEDSEVMRHVLVSHLKAWNYEIHEACDGQQAWDLFQQQPFSLVLTDWIMPEVDGLELIRRIRQANRPGYCYLILLTAKSEKEDLITAMEAGADDFLVKPCDQEELRVRLREGERIVRLEQTLAAQNRQLREAQAALVQSEKLAGLGQLAAGMAHEVNNPIAFVTNNLAVLRRDLAPLLQLVQTYQQSTAYLHDAPPELLQQIAELEQECDFPWLKQHLPQLLKSCDTGLTRVRDIISHLRDFARLDQAAYDVVDLRTAIRSTLQMLQKAIDEKHLKIEAHVSAVQNIACQPDKINQVIYNVVLNAVQASPPGESLVLRLKSIPGAARLEVQDFGGGMDAATLSRVFEPFFTTKPVGTGTGLGMAVSYGIVRDHGGEITIDSAVGQGTTVRIDLPLEATPASTLKKLTSPSPNDANHSQTHAVDC